MDHTYSEDGRILLVLCFTLENEDSIRLWCFWGRVLEQVVFLVDECRKKGCSLRSCAAFWTAVVICQPPAGPANRIYHGFQGIPFSADSV